MVVAQRHELLRDLVEVIAHEYGSIRSYILIVIYCGRMGTLSYIEGAGFARKIGADGRV